MKEIGGYFGLESLGYPHFHNNALALNSACNALQLLLQSSSIKRIYLPAYCCASLLTPLQRTSTPFSTYSINSSFEITQSISLADDEAILYVNYFGLKGQYIRHLHDLYGSNLIIDNSQAFFDLPAAPDCTTFYSPRKFLGVPDGGYLYSSLDIDISQLPFDSSIDNMAHLFIRTEQTAEKGYNAFREDDSIIAAKPLARMSKTTATLLTSISPEKFDQIALKRRENYFNLHSALSDRNLLNLPSLHESAVPMIYPFMTDCPDIRQKLIDKKIYIARYWSETVAPLRKDSEEARLRDFMLPLPVDQRYSDSDMERIIQQIRVCLT